MNEMVSVERMKKDLREAAVTMSPQEARYLVDSYYQRQEDRIREDGRRRSMEDSGEPHAVLEHLARQSEILEDMIKGALDKYSLGAPVGQWMRSNKGVGPVIAAGFMANLSILKRDEESGALLITTAGKFWSICGVNPALNADGKRVDRRVRGQKSNYNPSLKRLTWIVGECFKRQSDEDPDAHYRHIYSKRKALEIANNKAGLYADQCATSLLEKAFTEDTDARQWYDGSWARNPKLNPEFLTALMALPKKKGGKTKAEIKEEVIDAASADAEIEEDAEESSARAAKRLRGKFDPDALAELDAKFPDRPMLPPARIDRRAARYAAKMFLAHLHEVWWKLEHGADNYPRPYAIEHLGHVDKYPPPNLHVVGLAPAPEGAAPPRKAKRAVKPKSTEPT
jgi:hypothetical protein